MDTDVLVGVTTGSASQRFVLFLRKFNKDMKSVIRGKKNKSQQKLTCFNVLVFIQAFFF